MVLFFILMWDQKLIGKRSTWSDSSCPNMPIVQFTDHQIPRIVEIIAKISREVEARGLQITFAWLKNG